MVHGDAVADADDVELQRHAPGLPHAELDLLGDGAQVHVAGYELVVGVGDADEGPADVVSAHSQGAQEGAVRCPGGPGEETLTAVVQDMLLVTGAPAHHGAVTR